MLYYSEKLDAKFKTVEDLKAAEKAEAERVAAKKAASEAKKQEAKVVEDAYKAHNMAKRTYNEKILKLRKQYNTDLEALKKTFDEAVEAEAKALDEAAVTFNTALKDFTDKHGSYHMTLRDGDNVLTLSNQSSSKMEIIDPFADSMRFLESMSNLFRL